MIKLYQPQSYYIADKEGKTLPSDRYVMQLMLGGISYQGYGSTIEEAIEALNKVMDTHCRG